MTIWLALLVAPILALADQATALSMTAWACRGGHGLALHLVHAAFAGATAATIPLAWSSWRASSTAPAVDETIERRRFFARMAIGVSALSLLVIVAMWSPTWVLSSCLQ